jgi:hypothetical protein
MERKTIKWGPGELTRTEIQNGITEVWARRCEWFAKCERPATHLESHPVFPDGVPACDHCVKIGR